jgi:hypothetical protein
MYYMNFNHLKLLPHKPVQTQQMSGFTPVSGDFRVKQVAFWKKHQTMLQMCADLTSRCGAKVLVRRSSFIIP